MNVVEVLDSVVVAWVFYGVLGDFIVIPVFGAIAGFIAGRKNANSENKNRMIVLWSIVASGIPVLFLSTLDYIIFPW
jgi:small neutral amino acid transporter SnatA (MarC family)